MVVLIDSTTPKANGMVAVRGDPVEVRGQKLTEPFHFGEPLPAERLQPPEQEIQHAEPCLIGSESIELFAEDVRFEQSSVRGEQRLELRALRPTDRLPAPLQ